MTKRLLIRGGAMICLAVLLGIFLLPRAASAQTDWQSVVNRAAQSVVFIRATDTYGGQVGGSGAIISSDGYILTCAHVIDGAKSIDRKSVV